MVQIKAYDNHAAEYDQWYNDHPAIFQSELTAIKLQLLQLGENLHGIEVGLGSGRFAKGLGIMEGVEPAANLRKIAIKRGIDVMDAKAESLPYRDMHFDFVLFVTVLALDDVRSAFQEAYRVLKPGGSIIIGFIEKESLIGQAYMEHRKQSTFYKNANFYTVEEMKKILKQAKFKQPDFMQTLFGRIEEINTVQSPKPGYGEGSFIVVKANK